MFWQGYETGENSFIADGSVNWCYHTEQLLALSTKDEEAQTYS